MDSTSSIRVDYTDEDLRRRIRSYLASRHFPAFRKLAIKVQHGAVTLTGRVRSFHEKQVALNACQRVAGVLALIDEILVERPR